MKRTMYVFGVLVMLVAVLAACGAPAAPAPQAPAAEATEAAAPAEATEAAAPAAEATEAAAAPAEGAKAPGDMEFVTVVKIAGINWFNRMEEGVKQFGEEQGVKASLVGPAEADAAQQIPIIEDLIAQGVDALCVVPMDPAQLEPVLKKAMDAGIVVITHEASNQQNMDWDIEAFDNTAFGAGLMDRLAALMGEEGEYAVFVGSLGSKTHLEWADGGINQQLAKYPNMKMVGDKQETFDDSQKAYEKAKEILKAYPNIKGFQGSASTDVVGIGQAVEEAGLQDKIFVVGTSLPSLSSDLLKSGAIDVIGGWDPALAGKACNKLAQMQIAGETIGEGTNLGLTGYENLKLVGKNVLYADAAVYMTKDEVDNYPY
jgi:simple sugar transport system substrate-binding protein